MLPALGRQHRRCIISQTVTHRLVLLKMGKIISRNMLSLLELLISRYCCIYLVVYIIYTNDARSSKYQIMKYICWLNIYKSVLWRVAKRLPYIEDARCLKVNLYRHNSFIPSCCTKLPFVLVRDSVTYFSHHQGTLIFIKRQAANHTSRNFKHIFISIIQQSVDV